LLKQQREPGELADWSERLRRFQNAIHTPQLPSRGSRARSRDDLVLARWRIPPSDPYLEDDLNVEFLFDDPLVVAAGRQRTRGGASEPSVAFV
jgi:hypothetical protein